MNTVTLHYRDPAKVSVACSVCGASLLRGKLDRWWLRNTWTDKRHHYGEGEGCWPGDWMVPCGRLPDDSKTPNVGVEPHSAAGKDYE